MNNSNNKTKEVELDNLSLQSLINLSMITKVVAEEEKVLNDFISEVENNG